MYEKIRLIKQPKGLKQNFGCGHNIIIIVSWINETNNSSCPPYTSIPIISLLQGRFVIICHGDARYLFSKYLINLMESENLIAN